jgi:sporulation protein YlmC with PRC-barrel domain
MHNADIDTVLGWRGRTVLDRDGEKIGRLGDVFLDRQTDRPAWAGVRTGLFGQSESYVPLERVEEIEGDLRVPFSKDEVKDAPRIDPDVALSPEEEAALWRHYGQEYVHLGGDDRVGHDEEAAPPASTTTASGMRDDVVEPGRGEDAMTRSEEEVHIGEGPMRPAERVRLRKVMVTEHVRQTVPVRKEVIQLETDAPPEGHIESVEDLGESPTGQPRVD